MATFPTLPLSFKGKHYAVDVKPDRTLEYVRDQMAKKLNVDKDKIVLTSGGVDLSPQLKSKLTELSLPSGAIKVSKKESVHPSQKDEEEKVPKVGKPEYFGP